MSFSDPNSTHNPTTGVAIPAAWGDVVRDDLMALYGRPRARVYKSLTQGIGVGTVNVTFDQEFTDTHGMHSTVSNTDRLTVPTGWDGDWLVGATVLWTQSSAGTFRNAELWINDSLTICNDIVAIAGSGFCAQTLVMPFGGVAGDFYTLRVSQDSGGTLNLQPNGYAGCVLWATFLGNGAG